MMWWTRSEQAAAEARKVESASCTALLTPRQSHFTESVDWDQVYSYSVMFAEVDANNEAKYSLSSGLDKLC